MTDQPTPAEAAERAVFHAILDAEWDNLSAALDRALTLARTQGALEGHMYSCPGPVTCLEMHERIDARDAAEAAVRDAAGVH